jgi:colanic acid biosynthesis glycosyl transferase WcaI
MKISIHTMYFLPDFGSAPILMDELARHLAGRGHEVEVVTTFPRVSAPEFRGLAYSRRRTSGFVVKRVWAPRTPHPVGRLMAWNVYAAGALLNVLSRAKSDVLFLRTPPLQLGVPAFAAKRLRAARILLSVQDIHPDLAIESGILKNPAGIRLSRSLERWVYGLADRVVVISDGFRRNLLAKGVPGPKMSVIPNWVDTEFLRPLGKDNPVSRKFGFDGKFVLMYSGTISISSDLALAKVLDAARILAAERDIVFAVAGEGLRKDALRAKAAALGLRNVVFLPFQPYGDLPELLASADVLLVPLDGDKSELSVPSKLYNFMAAGRPVLGLAVPGSEVAAILREQQCGLPVSPGDAAEIADAVRALKGSPERRRTLAANGRAYVVERFAKDKILRAYEEIIGSMVS